MLFDIDNELIQDLDNMILTSVLLGLGIVVLWTMYSQNFLNFRGINYILTIGVIAAIILGIYSIIKRKVKVLSTILLFLMNIILIFAYFLIYDSIPLQKKTVENEVIQKEIKSLEKDYLKRKAEEIPDYSKELATLREIDGGIKRREYYSVIKFLVENSKNGIDYTKINYEKAKWIVQGEMENFNNFERLENNILRRYPNSELGYLKDNDTATVFEYVIEPFQN